MVGKVQSERELRQTEGNSGSQPLFSPSPQSHLSQRPGGRARAGRVPCLGLPVMLRAVPLLSCLGPPHPCTPAAQSRARKGMRRGRGCPGTEAAWKAGGGGGSHRGSAALLTY